LATINPQHRLWRPNDGDPGLGNGHVVVAGIGYFRQLLMMIHVALSRKLLFSLSFHGEKLFCLKQTDCG
jgi:hypothetical protein